VIGEIRSDGTKRWYVIGAMGYVCRIDEGANGEILARDYFVYDGLGSCRALVARNGVVVAKYDYDVYGLVRGQEGQRLNGFKYVAQIGHMTDEETGLIYMRARYYDPEIGRFVSEDPRQNGGNWYWYADGNPTTLIDATGKSPTVAAFLLMIDALILLGAAITAGERGIAVIFYLEALIMISAAAGLIASALGATPKQVADIVAKTLSTGIGSLTGVAFTDWLKSLGVATDTLGARIGIAGVTAVTALATYALSTLIALHLIDND